MHVEVGSDTSSQVAPASRAHHPLQKLRRSGRSRWTPHRGARARPDRRGRGSAARPRPQPHSAPRRAAPEADRRQARRRVRGVAAAGPAPTRPPARLTRSEPGLSASARQSGRGHVPDQERRRRFERLPGSARRTARRPTSLCRGWPRFPGRAPRWTLADEVEGGRAALREASLESARHLAGQQLAHKTALCHGPSGPRPVPARRASHAHDDR